MIQPSACCVLLLALLCQARTQTPPQQAEGASSTTATATQANQPERVPTLHDAWLLEVLDLDIKKAAAAYARVATDQRPGNLDRWVAVARLAELKRLGVDVTLPVDLKDVPEPLRAPLESISAPLPVADLLQRVQGDPKEVLQRIGTEDSRLPPLHPVTPLAEEWRLAQIPNSRARQQNSTPSGPNRINADYWVNLGSAGDIMRLELGGWRSQADARRAILFPNWQPPKLKGDPQPYQRSAAPTSKPGCTTPSQRRIGTWGATCATCATPSTKRPRLTRRLPWP
jgi:hypothetical protein